MKKILALILLALVAFPNLVQAANWQIKLSKKDDLRIEGSCSKDDQVTIYLYPQNDTANPIYNGGIRCDKQGNFEFEDNPAAWNIPEGTYTIALGDGQNPADFDHSEQFVINRAAAAAVPSDPNDSFVSEAANLAQGVQVVSDSFDRLSTSLDHTSFPDSVKTIVSGMLSAVKTLVVGLTEAILRLQKFIGSIGQNNQDAAPPADQSSTDQTPAQENASPAPAPSPETSGAETTEQPQPPAADQSSVPNEQSPSTPDITPPPAQTEDQTNETPPAEQPKVEQPQDQQPQTAPDQPTP
jgi:hypothetical protein